MTANQNTNHGYPAAQTGISVNTSTSPRHGYSASQPVSGPRIVRYQSSPVVFMNNPISHFSNQYTAHSPMNIYYQTNLRHAVNTNPSYIVQTSTSQSKAQQPIQSASSQPEATASSPVSEPHTRHARNSSLSYIQQRQQAFFSDTPIEPTSDSDDDIYQEMYKDGYKGAKRPTKGGPSKHKHKNKKQQTKSRQETEDVWCCSVCTYQNNMLLSYCELCGCKKSNKPNIIKRTVYPGDTKADKDKHKSIVSAQDTSASASPSDRTDTKQKQQQEGPDADLLGLTTSIQHKKKLKKPKVHRYARSAINVLSTKGHWRCAICTFMENPIERPVCKMCGALPPKRPPTPNAMFILNDNKVKKNNNAQNTDAIHDQTKEDECIEHQDTDPLGHQKSTSITELPILDKSVLQKDDKKEDKNELSEQNIIRGLSPQDVVPDLPPEKVDNNKNDSRSGGLLGFFGKVSNGWNRKRAQSEDVGATDKKSGNAASKRNISVATMPKKQQEKIAKRLGGLQTKKDLMRELDSSSAKLQKKLKQHAARVMQLKAEIVEVQKEREVDLAKWKAWYVLELVDLSSEYYSSRISMMNDEIELEKLHIECFTEKLRRLDNASLAIRRNGKKWNIDDIRNNIEVAFHTAWRIRLSADVPDKQDYVKQLAVMCSNLRCCYSVKIGLLGRAEISLEERKEQVFLFLQSTLAKYESYQQVENKEFKLDRLNLGNECDLYCPYNVTDQNVFDSFILDERCKEGRIVSRWLIFVAKKHREITFQDLADFMQKLAHTFLDSYCLARKQYYECVRILCYRCILLRKIIKKIIYNLLNIDSHKQDRDIHVQIVQCIDLDSIYQKKVMWMRALNEKQLGIKDDYWLRSSQANETQRNINGKRSSQIALLAGKDIPFAHSINLVGNLEIDVEIIEQYRDESVAISKQAEIKKKQEKRSFLQKRNELNIIPAAAVYMSDIIPFVLPQTALETLLSATKCIYKTAMKYYYIHYPEKENDVNDEGAFISQDDLFPIILYCVIQSKLETPHKLIYFIENILPNEKTTMGQSAFALSALKAAVEYISQANPTSFGMDAEIELD